MVAENASLKGKVEKQAVEIKGWKKTDKELKVREKYLTAQKVKLDADKRALEERDLDREHLTKTDLKVSSI